MSSSLVVAAKSSTTKELRMEKCYMTYKDVRAKHGHVAGKAIYHGCSHTQTYLGAKKPG